jgi:hypothetical protein
MKRKYTEVKLKDMYDKIAKRLCKELELDTSTVSWLFESGRDRTEFRLKLKTCKNNPSDYYLKSKYYEISITGSTFTFAKNRHPGIELVSPILMEIKIVFNNKVPITLNAIPKLVKDTRVFMGIFDYLR